MKSPSKCARFRSTFCAVAALFVAASVFSCLSPATKDERAVPVADNAVVKTQVIPHAAAAPSPRSRTAVTYLVPVLTSETCLFGDETVDRVTKYEWDESKRQMLSQASFEKNRSEASERSVYSWLGGKLLGEKKYDASGKLRSSREYRYDAEGNLVEERTLDEKGVVILKSTYSHDSKGNKTAWKNYLGEDSLVADTEYRWSQNGLDTIIMKNPAGALEGKVIMANDAKGRVLKREFRDKADVVTGSETMVYDGDKLVKSSAMDGAGFLKETISFKYGAYDVPDRKTWTDARGKVRKIVTYTYLTREEIRYE